MEDATTAAARKLQQDGEEIAALLTENMHAAALREGRQLELHDVAGLVAPLMSAVWQVTKIACGGGDGAARLAYAALLRRHADGVDGMG